MNSTLNPLVVQYLYVHGQDEEFFYPSARSPMAAASVATRYLECAVVQAATLRLRDVDCDLALATNISDGGALGRAGAELLRRLDDLGVAIVTAEYRHRPSAASATYVSSRYLFDAILAAAEGQPERRRLLMTDLDCVWLDPDRLFAAIPAPPEVGCIHIQYPADWQVVGFGDAGRTPAAMAQLAHELGGSEELPRWVGGELIVGSPSALCGLVAGCEELDALLSSRGHPLGTEEQIMTLSGALGKVRFKNLAELARRVHTGPRHHDARLEAPLSLALWHLPGEKGLSLRRTAREVTRGRSQSLRRDLSDPARMAKRFNVQGAGQIRRIRDDGWLVAQRLSGAVRRRLPSGG